MATDHPILFTNPTKILKKFYLLRDESDSYTSSPSSGRSTDTVNIIFGMGRYVEIDHYVHVRDIQSSEKSIILLLYVLNNTKFTHLLATSVAINIERDFALNLFSDPNRLA